MPVAGGLRGKGTAEANTTPTQAQSELLVIEERQLEEDPRWQLVLRIHASAGFERATQLRNLLTYISRNALLHPEVVLREYEIACDVLGRRRDFDPSRDNIARAQVSHLRRKLEQYFSTDGKDEPLILTIQKGSYAPVFRPASNPNHIEEATHVEHTAPSHTNNLAAADSSPMLALPLPLRRNLVVWLAVVLCGVAVIGTLMLMMRPVRDSTKIGGAHNNAFVRFLGRLQGNVTIVAPDLSLVMVRRLSGADISVSDYTSADYPARQLASVKDPFLRARVLELMIYPNTTLNEAMIGFDFKDALQRMGVHSEIRYARNLHVEDLSQGNSLLVGGEGSNLWTSLFMNKMNFRFVQVNDHLHYFENAHPLSGESPRYTVTYPSEGKISIGYVDIALTQNPTRTGYVLLVNGSDLQASEAATRYLLHGSLPKELTAMLEREDLQYFEILLRGRHIGEEAEDNVDVVAVRH